MLCVLYMLTHARLDVQSGIWGVNVWKQFENDPSRLVPKTPSILCDAVTSSPNSVLKASPEPTSSNIDSSTVHVGLSDAAATVDSVSANSKQGQQQILSALAPQQPQPGEQAIEQGDGSEFWS